MSSLSGTSQGQGQKKINPPKDIYKRIKKNPLTEEQKKALKEAQTKTQTDTTSSSSN